MSAPISWVEWNKGDPRAKCKVCHKTRTVDGHDPCIANLPGVKYACCGHGEETGYIYFENETVIQFKASQIDYYEPTAQNKKSKPSVHFDRFDPTMSISFQAFYRIVDGLTERLLGLPSIVRQIVWAEAERSVKQSGFCIDHRLDDDEIQADKDEEANDDWTR